MMQALEGLRYRRQEAAPLPPPKDVVRTVITQPVSLADFKTALGRTTEDFARIELTHSLWIVKDQNAQNPGQIMAIGGEISDDDRKAADNLARENTGMMDRSRHQSAVLGFATCRHALDKVHLQGVVWAEPTLLRERTYQFFHTKKGTVRSHESWMGLSAPADYKPFTFNRDDKIGDVIPLSPSRVRTMFRNGSTNINHHTAPLVDSLLTDEAERTKRRVVADQAEVEQIQAAVMENVMQAEKTFRLFLVSEIASQSKYANGDDAKRRQNMINVWEDTEAFNQAYREFLNCFADKLPAIGSKYKRTRLIQETLRGELTDAWHRVHFKMGVHHAASIPVQGELLAARLPLEDASTDELDSLEKDGPELFRKVSRMINGALTVDDPNYPDLKEPPKTAEERYRRLELYRRLKIHENNGLNPNELLLLKLWHQHMYNEMERTLGISPTKFARLSTAKNTYFNAINHNIAPRVSQKSSAPALLARHPFSTTTQIDEWLLIAHGYNPYVETPRGVEISHQAIFDTRFSLAHLPLWDESDNHYFPAISKSTYHWRRILYTLFRGPNGHSEHKEELGEFHTIASAGLRDGNKRTIVVPATETNLTGITVRRMKTNLVHEGIPIVILENTNDKEFYNDRRKADERGWRSAKILDVYRTSLTIDTESPEIKRELEKGYAAYIANSLVNLHKPVSMDEWVLEWSNGAIRSELIPQLSQHSRSLGFIYDRLQEKDKLDDGSPTDGSAASKGGYRELKFYASLKPSHILADGEDETQQIEVAVYPTPTDYYIKSTDDDDYAQRRFDTVRPGSGLYTLWNVYYPPDTYEAYSDVAGRLARQRQKRSLASRSAEYVQINLEKIFGPVSVTLFRRH